MRPVSTKRSTDKLQPAPSTTGGPIQLQIQPKYSTSSLPSGFILSSSSSSEEAGPAAPSLVAEVDDQSTMRVDKQPPNPLPDEITKASAPTPAPFTSISFEVENSHLLQTGNPFPFSPQSSPLPSSSSSSGLPFVFSSPSSSGNQSASTKFSASPSTPVASTTTSSSRASEPPKQSFTLKARKEDTGKSPVSKVRKTRAAKSKEELKEEMKMKISIEDKVIEWTQEEKETMLRLPRKECTDPHLSFKRMYLTLRYFLPCDLQISLKTRRSYCSVLSTWCSLMPTIRGQRWYAEDRPSRSRPVEAYVRSFRMSPLASRIGL